MRALACFALLVAASAPPAEAPRPIFVPGLYETESRNAAFANEGARTTTCLADPDYDAFRRGTIARFLREPQFGKVCGLSDTRPIAGGFAFAMDCGGARTIIAYRFAKDLVSSTAETAIPARPDYSSTILTLWRRIGDCRSDGKF